MYEVNNEKFDNYDDALEYCYEQEIIYYHNAIEYLSNNDSSFTNSLKLASELGFSCENLNSETLATVHYQSELINSIKTK